MSRHSGMRRRARSPNPEVSMDRDARRSSASHAPRNDRRREAAMNFDDTPQEAEFRADRPQMDRRQRAEAIRGGAFKILARPHPAAEGRDRRCRQGLAEEEGRRRLGLPALAEGIWRPRRHPDREGDLAAGRGRLRQADAAVPDRRGHVRADRDGVRQRGAQAALSAEARLRRTDLVPAVLRAGRRLRRRGPAHARGEEGRQLDRQRPEDLDLGRALFRLRPADHAHRSQRAQAQGADDVLPRHEEPGRRGAADQAGQRHAGIQRGLFHRRRDSRSASASARSATAGTSR